MRLTCLFITVSALAVVQTFAALPRPVQSGPIALSSDDKWLVNVNPDSGSVTVFELSGSGVIKRGEVKTGRDPESVAIHPDNTHAYVANAQDGTVVVVDLNTRRKRGLIRVGAEPMAVALSPNGTRLYVANSASDNLMIFDITGTKPSLVTAVSLSPFGTAPRAIAVTNDGDGEDADETVFVALFFGQLRPGKTFLDEGQDDEREGRLVALNAATGDVVAPNPILIEPIASTGFNSNGRLAPATGLTPAVLSTNPQAFNTPTAAYPNQLATIAIQPGQSRAYVPNTAASPNGPFRFNSNVQGLISVFDTTTRLEITAAQTDLNVRRTAPLNMNQGVNLATTPVPRLFLSNPVGMAWRPDGSDAWVVIQNSDLLVRLTVDTDGIPTVSAPLVLGPSQIVRVDLQDVSSRTIAGKAPRGVVINSAGTLAYVFNYVSRSISVVDISNPTDPFIVSTPEASKAPKANSPDGVALLGEELFFTGRGPQGRMSSDSWGGCIVCHPNGRSDNVTWMFDAGPRQTIPLDGISDPKHRKSIPPRILNWSAVRDEVQDFELNTRGVFGGRGLINDDRLFFALGGTSGTTPTDSGLIEQFQQVTLAVGVSNDFTGAALPALAAGRRDFATATLDDGRVFIIGGRTGAGQGTLVTGADAVLEFNPRANTLRPPKRGYYGGGYSFTPRHSHGAAAVWTSKGFRIYVVGGYDSTNAIASPVALVEEYNPDKNKWRAVASLPTAVAQFGITVSGGNNTNEPRQLIHVVSGNTGSEATPSVANPNPVQRFQPDPGGDGAWTPFNPAGLTLRRNHGAATVFRGVTTRVFVIGGQDGSDTVLSTVEEYLGQAVTVVTTPHTDLPAPRAHFGIAASLSTQQIYVMGGVDGAGADQTSILEYSVANNGTVAGPPGTPSGTWMTRGNLSVARRDLQVSRPPGVENFLPTQSSGRDPSQDAIAAWVTKKIRPAKAPLPATDDAVKHGRELFGQVGLVVANFSCATCHGGSKWTRSAVDYPPPPSPEIGLGLGDERVIGAELRQTKTQGTNSSQLPGVLVNVGTFAPNTAGGRVNEIRANGADASQAIAALGANGLNIPSLLSAHETAPYFYSGQAQTLENVLDGSADGNGGTRQHFVTDAAQRTDLVKFLQSIDEKTPIFK